MPEDLIIGKLSDVGVWRELTLPLGSFMKRWQETVDGEAVKREAVNQVVVDREEGATGGRRDGREVRRELSVVGMRRVLTLSLSSFMESSLEALDLDGGTPESETLRQCGGKRDESRDSNHSCTLSIIHKYAEYLRVARNAGLKLT
jgi:hypothetical protein